MKVTDVLPKGLTYISNTLSKGSYDNTTGVWEIGDLNNGETVTLNIQTSISSLGSIINIVNITGAERDWDMTNNNANSTETGTNRPIPPIKTVDLTVNKTVNSSHIIKGDTISWIITVYNNGPDTATNVKVTDLLPKGLVYINSTASKGSYDSTNGVWTIGDLTSKEAVSLTIITRTIDSGFITNNVNVTSTEKDINQTNNNANLTILVHPVIDLTVNKTVNSSHIIKGDTISWVITISNNGPDTATNVKVTDLLPEGLVYINSLVDKGTYNSSNGIWIVGELNVGETVSLTIITKTVEAGFITNNVNITGEEKDLNISNNEANVTITVHPIIDLTGNKTVNNTNPKYGDTIEWIITIWNNGPDPATNVTVSDLLPKGLIYLNSIASKGSYSPNTSIWTIGDLNLGETVTLHIITKVNVSNTTLINSVNITGEEKDWNLSNNYPSANITIPVNNNTPSNETPGNDTPSNPITPSNPNNHNISTSNSTNLTNSRSNEGSLASGISMKSTGNPILVLLLILVVLGGIIPYRKRK